TWIATGSSPNVTGYTNGSGNLIQQTLFNSGYMMPTVTYQVAPTANGCAGTQNSVVVTVNPLPVVSFPVCFDTLTTTLAQPFILKGVVPSGGSFTGTGVTGSTFYPGIAGVGTHRIRYTYTNNFGCVDSASRNIRIVDPVPHNCGDTVTDIRDSKRYPTVLIGTQCWMANNLDRGSTIASSQMQRDNCINEKYCYNDNPANCTAYGGLYQWDEVMRYVSDNGAQGLCPPGWHIPTEGQWNILFNFYISNGFAGNALKSSGYSGFNALMTGIRFHNSVWKFPANDPVLRSKLYWSSTLHGPQKAWAHGMNEVVADIEYTPSVSFYSALMSNAFAVRCVKD
ncbi:MAG: FISUMP domain-containing protein, partial [Bacteroidota bacterium]